MAWVPDELKKVKEDIDAGKERRESVRNFLRWFGYARRGRSVVGQIRSALRRLELTTSPDFDATWIDGHVRFFKIAQGAHPSAPVVTTTPASSVDATAPNVEPGSGKSPDAAANPPPVRTLEGQDPSYSVRKLDAANRPPVTINPNATVKEAITIMLARDFSQLPVMQGDRSVKGLFSWKSLGSRLALKRPVEKTSEAMDMVQTVSAEASMFQIAEMLATNDVVLVQASATDNKIVGIITPADMAEQFGKLGEPFLLIGEIENRVRVLIDGKFTLAELKGAKNPGDTERQIESVADLSFGEYVRLLENPKYWEKCKLEIDRAKFIEDLKDVNEVRNDVMHFEPEGIGDEALDRLRQFAQFLSRLAQLSDK